MLRFWMFGEPAGPPRRRGWVSGAGRTATFRGRYCVPWSSSAPGPALLLQVLALALDGTGGGRRGGRGGAPAVGLLIGARCPGLGSGPVDWRGGVCVCVVGGVLVGNGGGVALAKFVLSAPLHCLDGTKK
jgi:hypothetical protein